MKNFIPPNRILLMGGAVLCGMLLMTSAAAGTCAYLQDQTASVNELTIGHCEAKIREEFDPPDRASDDPFEKRVWIENTGTLPCYVRVFLDFSRGEAGDASSFSADGKDYYPAAEYREHYLPEGWIYGPDGYYYYTPALQPAETTPDLIASVRTDYSQLAENLDYDIIVYMECTQIRDGQGVMYTGENACWTAWNDAAGKQ